MSDLTRFSVSLESDLLEVLFACSDKGLDRIHPGWSDNAAATVVMSARGYPGAYLKGDLIHGLDRAAAMRTASVESPNAAIRASTTCGVAGAMSRT